MSPFASAHGATTVSRYNDSFLSSEVRDRKLKISKTPFNRPTNCRAAVYYRQVREVARDIKWMTKSVDYGEKEEVELIVRIPCRVRETCCNEAK